jgi:queuosine precursor transporter
MDRKQKFYVWLTGAFVAALIASDLIGGKFFRVRGIDLSIGMIPFPLTFLLTDIVNEFYGAAGARRLTFVGLAMAIFVFAIINIGIALPTSPESPMSGEAFRAVFGWSSRLYLASLSAYLAGQLLDISVFYALRRITGHRLLWVRATGSTVLSQAIDTLVVNFVLLAGTKPPGFILTTARNSYLVKLVIAVALTPLIYLGHGLLRRHFGVKEEPEAAAGRD